MKLEDETTQQIGEINLSDLRSAAERESPSSFNKSMDFARHTKRNISLRNPPSRECSNDILGSSCASTSLLGESFFGDSFAGCSFALSDDDHEDVAPAPRAVKRPDLETVIDLEGDEDGQNSSKDAEVEKTELSVNR